MSTPQTPTAEMARAYDHRQVEERLYQDWLAGGYFTPTIEWSRKPFTIVIPPPNITGELHYGHAMFVTFQDLMIRWRRMQGRPTLWLPGTDHAGIATQNVVEAEIAREGLTRFDLGREEFVRRVWRWKEKYGSIINFQLRRLGASCDWTRERFTLDAGLSRAVREAFVRLHNKGLIYRGAYIINWCPRCTTALSDLEVDHEETAGKLWYVKYPLVPVADGVTVPEFITVATTRPETILGDTGVAVNPGDERYTGLIGRQAMLPVVGRVISIVADAAVDPQFGTGAVKVTPAHDPTDFEIGQRRNLPAVNVMNPNATMNENAGPYQGLDRSECRRQLLAELERQGLLARVEDHVHSVGQCSRCHTVVEPWLSEQWFVRIRPLAEPAMEAVRTGAIRFVPERFTRIYFNWMENIRDWCISRQLWWGHRIPVWYCDACSRTIVAVETPTGCPDCGNSALRQDEDVLDTWFSSGLWPFSTLGWPDDTADLRYFYPTDVMETGYDIIFFWVARMIMFGLECTGQVPFRDVYLHGLLRDEKGEKMSKSKGNVANPLAVIDRYGADALRFTIITGSSPGNDIKLMEDKLEGSRNFANKLWNAARFVVMSGDALGEAARHYQPRSEHYDLADRWILSRLGDLTTTVTRLYEDYQFNEGTRAIYEFLWSEYCDWYIEIAKIRLHRDQPASQKLTAQSVLETVLDASLRLLHPAMPFVTEAIWEQLPHRPNTPNRTTPLIVAPWPAPTASDLAAEAAMEVVIGIVRAIRNARAEFKVEPARRIAATIVVPDGASGGSGEHAAMLESQRAVIETLARVDPLTIVERIAERPRSALHLLVGGVEIDLPLAGMVDLQAETARTSSEITATRQQIERIETRLADQAFTTKAPAAVIEKERARLAVLREQLTRLEERLAALTS
ncbi:MAG: valine--tRNA ligase [Chloroflexi bacterium]|nr:valine--tRNA ligase [Chloroflexota bacterium]